MSLDDFPTNAPQRPASQSEPVVRRVDRAAPSVVKITRAEELRLQLADEIVRGTLPPGILGTSALEDIAPQVIALAAEADRRQGDRGGCSIGVDVAVGDGRRIVGTVHRVYDEVLLSCGYSRLGPKARLQAWVRMLVLTVMEPARAYRSVIVARDPHVGKLAPAVVEIAPLDPAAARRALSRLVRIYDAGMCTAPMVFTRTSAAYADGVLSGAEPRRGTGHLRKHWRRGFGASVPGENEDPSHVLVLGGRLDFDQLWSRHGDALRTSAASRSSSSRSPSGSWARWSSRRAPCSR